MKKSDPQTDSSTPYRKVPSEPYQEEISEPQRESRYRSPPSQGRKLIVRAFYYYLVGKPHPESALALALVVPAEDDAQSLVLDKL